MFHGVLGVGQLIGTAIAGANLYHALKGPCGGLIFRRCFVADTQVVVAQGIAGTTEAHADLVSSTPDMKRQAASGLGVTCPLVAAGGLVIQIDSRRKRRDGERRRAIDDFFASGDIPKLSDNEGEANWIDSISDPLPHPSAHGLDQLCDQLFTSEDDIGKPSRSLRPAPDRASDSLCPVSDRDMASRSLCPVSDRGTPPTEGLPLPTASPILAVDNPQRERETEGRESAMPTPQICEKTDDSPTRTRGRIATSVGLVLLALLGSLLASWGLGSGEQPAALARMQPAFEYETRSIQDIREGDVVLARDEHGHAIDLKQVVETYERTSDHLRILTFESRGGTRQTLKTTDEHPFWVVDEDEFVEAENLSIGDRVTGPNGEVQTVIATTHEPHPEGIAVYNFQVDDYHTYYVREDGTRAPPGLVHNANYRRNLPKPKRKYVTYTADDLDYPGCTYVGRASGVDMTPEQILLRRKAGHHRNLGALQLDQTTDSYPAIRRREQLVRDHLVDIDCGTEQINPISPRNKSLETYLRDALDEFGEL